MPLFRPRFAERRAREFEVGSAADSALGTGPRSWVAKRRSRIREQRSGTSAVYSSAAFLRTLEPADAISWQALRYRPHLAEYGGESLIVVVTGRELSDAQESGMGVKWFEREVAARTQGVECVLHASFGSESRSIILINVNAFCGKCPVDQPTA